jgi:hypothetical protein
MMISPRLLVIALVTTLVTLSSALLWAQGSPHDSWQLAVGADGDGAWVTVTGFDVYDDDLSCHWTVQQGDVRHTITDDYAIPDEGLCLLMTAVRLPDLLFPPATPLVVSLEVHDAAGAVVGTAGPRSVTFDPTQLVSTEALFAALTAAGWRYTGAEHIPSFGEGYRGYNGVIERGEVDCYLDFHVGQVVDRHIYEGSSENDHARGVNHLIWVSDCEETMEQHDDPQAPWVRGSRRDLQTEVVALLRGVVQPAAAPQAIDPPEAPTSMPH